MPLWTSRGTMKAEKQCAVRDQEASLCAGHWECIALLWISLYSTRFLRIFWGPQTLCFSREVVLGGYYPLICLWTECSSFLHLKTLSLSLLWLASGARTKLSETDVQWTALEDSTPVTFIMPLYLIKWSALWRHETFYVLYEVPYGLERVLCITLCSQILKSWRNGTWSHGCISIINTWI